MAHPDYITLNGTHYATANLSAAAKSQVSNIQAVDAELARLQQQLAIAQTARNAYSAALVAEIKGAKAEVPAEKPKRPRAARKAKAQAN